MPRGHLTPFPRGYMPLKTAWGWTVVRLRTDKSGLPVALDWARTPDQQQILFWPERRMAAQAVDGMLIVARNEELEETVRRLEQALAHANGTGAARHAMAGT